MSSREEIRGGSTPFPIRIGAMFNAGISGFMREPLPLLVGGALTLGAYAVLAVPGLLAWNDDQVVLGSVLFVASLILGGTAAYPWFTYALRAARDEAVDVAEPFRRPRRFIAQFVCAFWFSAAFMLGSLFFFIPALLTILFYAFYGYVVADDWTRSGVMALGTSVPPRTRKPDRALRDHDAVRPVQHVRLAPRTTATPTTQPSSRPPSRCSSSPRRSRW